METIRSLMFRLNLFNWFFSPDQRMQEDKKKQRLILLFHDKKKRMMMVMISFRYTPYLTLKPYRKVSFGDVGVTIVAFCNKKESMRVLSEHIVYGKNNKNWRNFQIVTMPIVLSFNKNTSREWKLMYYLCKLYVRAYLILDLLFKIIIQCLRLLVIII